MIYSADPFSYGPPREKHISMSLISVEPAVAAPSLADIQPENGFAAFAFGPSVQRAIAAAGFTEPRPIQAEAIPIVLTGADVLGLAQTGTGKTAAFGLPIVERLLSSRGAGTKALIIAPTRELASQILVDIQTFAKFTNLKAAAIYGGVPFPPQIRTLRSQPEVLVACPGRLLDLFEQGHVNLARIQTLVLDEADHLFDMGFMPDIKRILAILPKRRQNLLFSATMPPEIWSLANSLLTDPQVVDISHSTPLSTIEHSLYPVADASKTDLVIRLLKAQAVTSAIVFTRTKHRAKRLAIKLESLGHNAVALQGNMTQPQRDRATKGFRKGEYDILVATDVAARGLDIEHVSHVINFDIPTTPDAYTHRIGRTGRSGRDGQAFTLVSRDDRDAIRAIERKLGSPIERRYVDGFEGENVSSDDSERRQGKKPSGATRRAASGRSSRFGPRSSSPQGGGRGRSGESRSGESRSGDTRSGGGRSEATSPAREGAAAAGRPRRRRRSLRPVGGDAPKPTS